MTDARVAMLTRSASLASERDATSHDTEFYFEDELSVFMVSDNKL